MTPVPGSCYATGPFRLPRTPFPIPAAAVSPHRTPRRRLLPRGRCRLLATLVLALWASGAAASPLADAAAADGALVAAASLVVEARVTDVEPAPFTTAPRAPARDHWVSVERVVAGVAPGTALVVRTPGGVAADGVAFTVPGSPRFAVGERLLLFLAAGADGTYHLPALGLGAFSRREATVERAGGGPARAAAVWVRGHDGPLRAATAEPGLRDVARFRAWIAARARGEAPEASYWLRPAAPLDGFVDPGGDGFRLAVSSSEAPPLGCGAEGGRALRWFVFDTGNGLPWFPSRRGFPTAADGHLALDSALAAWTAVPAARVRLLRGEVSDAEGGLGARDGLSTVRYEDPDREIAGRYDGSGPLAVAGLWHECTTRAWIDAAGDEQRVHEIVEADVVLQDGLAAELASLGPAADAMSTAAELLAHQLGHALGLLDSVDPQAVMASELHADGRGARLSEDDGDALRALYGPHGPLLPIAPSGLLAVPNVRLPSAVEALPPEVGQVRLRWRDRALDEVEQRLDVAVTSRFIELPTAIPADARELIVNGLPPGREVRFRVRAINEQGSSSPSNVATLETPENELCVQSPAALCLLGGRYRVAARFTPPAGGKPRPAHAVALADGAGAFWFFHRDNLEAVVRLEREPDGRLRLDASSLTTVVHELVVTDTVTGAVARLSRAEGLCSVTRDDLLPAAAATLEPEVLLLDLGSLALAHLEPPAAPDAAAAEEATELPAICRERDVLCLHDGRFAVQVAGFDAADAIPLAASGIVVDGDVAFFAFGEAADLDVAVKILDARGLASGFWLSHSGLGDRPYRLTVTDRTTGLVHQLERNAGRCGGTTVVAAQ